MFARQLGSDLFKNFKPIAFYFFLIGLLLVACSDNQEISAVPSPSVTPTLQPPTAMPTGTITLTSVLPPATLTPTATAMPTTTPSSTPTPTITPTPTLDPFFTFVETTPQAVEGGSVKVEIFPSEDYTDLLLRITRDSIIIQESSVDPVIFNDEDRFPDGGYPPILGVGIETVSDLDLDGEPEIVLDTITQGTNCCTSVVVLFFDIDGQQYHRTNSITRHWRFSPRLIDIDQGGRPEFVTRNEEFNYLVGGDSFTSVVSPLHILRYENRAIVDVTYQYPELVEQDAALWLAGVQGEIAELTELYTEITLEDPEFWITGVHGNEFFALKSYMADMITLGRGYEGCQNVQVFFESDYERWSGVFERYGDNICPNFMVEIEAALEGRMVES